MIELKKGSYSGNIINSSEENGIICSHTSYFGGNFNAAKHYHENMHLSLVLDGYCLEKKKLSYDRKPGHFTFYHAGEPHQVLNVSDYSRHINIEIEPSFFHNFDIDECSLEFSLKDIPDIKFLMIKFYHDLIINDEFTAIAKQNILLNILHRQIIKEDSRIIPSWVKVVDEFLRENWNCNVTLAELSKVTGVHPVTISKYFSRYFGCTLGSYMRKLKVEQSFAAIKSKGGTLTEIAYQCGFADQSHFTRTFKSYIGVLPSTYEML